GCLVLAPPRLSPLFSLADIGFLSAEYADADGQIRVGEVNKKAD
uniref:Uncharacterized protein n=1 Tax=Plectus sambesii TaxID=2011161 RepID=A0A914UPR0_9BILA